LIRAFVANLPKFLSIKKIQIFCHFVFLHLHFQNAKYRLSGNMKVCFLEGQAFFLKERAINILPELLTS
ncbi:MAG: hypothetical protein R6W78_02640, partial [Bacteroidales bacterium]